MVLLHFRSVFFVQTTTRASITGRSVLSRLINPSFEQMESHSKPSSVDLERGTSPTVTPQAEQGSQISEREEPGKERPGGSIKKAEEKTSEQDQSNVVDWDGPKDPLNPLNWTPARKGTMIAIVSFITFLSYVLSRLCLSFYGSAILVMESDLKSIQSLTLG